MRILIAFASAVSALVLLAAPLLAQREQNVWYFGRGTGVDFNSGVPVPLNNSAMNAGEGSASVADPETGELLFYTDGITVYNSAHRPMPNGSGLLGHYSATQSVLVVPMPGDSRRYYLFTTDAVYTAEESDGLHYSIVNMDLDGGLGDVDVKNRLLFPLSSEKITAIPVCSDSTTWVIAHDRVGLRFRAYHLTRSGLSAPVESIVGGIPYDGGWDAMGYLTASPDGSRLAAAVGGGGHGGVEIFRFDKRSGAITYDMFLPVRSENSVLPYGVEFSPDNSKLYTVCWVGEQRLVQFDLSRSSVQEIIDSQQAITDGLDGGSVWTLMLGPDERIYLRMSTARRLDAITMPNNAVPDIGYVREVVSLASNDGIGLPNMYKLPKSLQGARGPSDTTICSGSTLRLVPRGGVSYRWTGPDLSCTTCASPTVTPLSTTRYYVEIGNGSGCFVLDSVTVTVVTPRPISVSGDTSMCAGDSVRLSAEGVDVFWTPGTGLDCDTCATVSASPDETTTYTVRYRDGGCRAEASVTITVMPRPAIAVSADTAICAGESVRLSASGGTVFRWSPATGLSCTDCPDPVATPPVSTEFVVTVSSDAGCTDTASVRVGVAPLPVVDAGERVAICLGNSTALHATGAASYRWEPSSDLSCLDCPDPVARPLGTTTYYVTGSSTEGCVSARDSVTITVAEPPRLVLRGDSAVCLGTAATIIASGADSYLWSSNSAALDCPTCPGQLVRPLGTTTYYVVATTAGGCSARDSFIVRVGDAPDLDVTGDVSVCAGEEVHLRASGAATYRWEPSMGLSCSDCAEPIARSAVTTTYRVIGSLPGDCSDTAYVTVTVGEAIDVVASLPRGIELLPGASTRMAVSVDRSFAADSIAVDLSWYDRMVSIDEIAASPALLAEGWTMQTTDAGASQRSLLLTQPRPVMVTAGEILEMRVSAYLGDSMSSEIALRTRASAPCVAITSTDGQVRLDSICGLSFRMIEVAEKSLALLRPAPNPSSSSVRLQMMLPFAGTADVAIIDPAGAIVRQARITAAHAGVLEHAMEIAGLDAGVYVVRLRFGDEVREERLVVVR